MDVRAIELVLRKLIDAMERRCAGFPIGYELELLIIETAKEQLDKIQAKLDALANIQQQVQADSASTPNAGRLLLKCKTCNQANEQTSPQAN